MPGKALDGSKSVVSNQAASILALDNARSSRDTTASNCKSRGYSVILADSGEQALALAKAHSPDMVLLDARLPEIDGLQVLKDPAQNALRLAVAHHFYDTRVEQR
ncbi:MAG: response regulator [Gammaproteobacteria bacterium]|nr:response regulator [Gammaproteobacteria bacterium]